MILPGFPVMMGGAAAAAAGLEYVGGTTANIEGTTLTVSLTGLTGGLASQPATDDIVIIGFGCTSQTDENLSVTTSGYTQIAELYANDNADANLEVSYKVMGGTPDTEVVVTHGSSTAFCAVVHVWRGVDTTTPMDVTGTTATGINTCLANPPAITPTTGGAIIIAFGFGAQNVSTVVPLTQSGSELSNFRSSERSKGFASSALAGGSYEWTSGAFNPVAFACTRNNTQDSWAAITLALRPA